MNLRLNPAHPLCQPSRNLVFATFGTGYGAQVLDLSPQPVHGVITHGATTTEVARTLTTGVPAGFPSDYECLAMRSSGLSQVSFGNPKKVTEVTDNFTVAAWVRPWSYAASVSLYTTVGNVSNGWCLIPTITAGGFLSGAWVVNTFDSTTPRSWQSNSILTLGQWSLVAFSWQTSAGTPPIRMYTNGFLDSLYLQPPNSIITASNQFLIGAISTVPSYCDHGPAFVWGSVLSADDIALLYRDTWGMVTRAGISTASRVSASATTTTTTTTTTLAARRPTLGGRGMGSPYIGGYRPGFLRKDEQ